MNNNKPVHWEPNGVIYPHQGMPGGVIYPHPVSVPTGVRPRGPERFHCRVPVGVTPVPPLWPMLRVQSRCLEIVYYE